MKRRKHHLGLPLWPNFVISQDNVDGSIPAARVKGWSALVEILNSHDIFNNTNDAHWGLTPTIARHGKYGTYRDEWAIKQLDRFKYSIRGRTDARVSQMDDEEVWSIGQHHGLMTPLLDWSHSPYVAFFFAVNQPDDESDNPKNYSRTVFFLNKTKLEENGLDEVFVNTLSSEHDRLTSQDGLFTLSPGGETNLVSHIINTLGENAVDVDDPNMLKDFIFKIHIPMESESDRLKCIKALRRMNLHFANLYPDIEGSSHYCNELLTEIIQEELHHERN